MAKEFKYNIKQHVKTNKYAYEGRIYKRYHKLPESKEWLKNQDIPFTKSEIQGNWYLVETLTNGRYYGCVCVAESDINLII